MTPESGERCEGIICPVTGLPINLAVTAAVVPPKGEVMVGTSLHYVDGVFSDCILKLRSHMDFGKMPCSFTCITWIFASQTQGL